MTTAHTPEPSSAQTATSLLPPAMVLGFGTAVAMWLVGFVTHLPGLRAGPMAVAALLIVAWVAGAVIAGRVGGPRFGVRLGAGASLVTALVNLLILGALLAEAPSGEAGTGEGGGAALRPNWAVVLGGYFVFALVVGIAGGFVGARTGGAAREPRDDARDWLGRFAKVAVAAAVPVIFSGGLVTSAGAGLAVPDWPNSFGSNMFLFPLSRMTGGIYYEHAHRLFGSLIGLSTLTLLVFALRAEARGWVKALVVGVFVLVVVQGVLGGIGVTSANAHLPSTADAVAALPNPGEVPADYATRTDTGASRGMRMVHGVLGQVTFAALCGIAAVTARSWRRFDDSGVESDGALRTFTTALLLLMVLQLAFGAAARHFQHTHALYSHVGFAVFVFTASALAAFRALRLKHFRAMKVLGHGIMHGTLLQFALGLAALFLVLPYDGTPHTGAGFVLASLHQFNGAALIGMSAALWAWSRRVTAG